MIYCPNCKNELDVSTLTCGGETCLGPQHGVARLFKQEFANFFLPHEKRFRDIRRAEGKVWEETDIYEKMPFLSKDEGKGFGEWKAFQQDLKLIFGHLENKPKAKILNYGSWNGWLSNQLVKKGHEVTAVAYFSDSHDGLGAQQWFQQNWLSIQMHIEEDLDILDEKYDCIIMNRGICFSIDAAKTVKELIAKLNPEGILIATGLNVYPDPTDVRQTRANFLAYYREHFQFEMGFTDSKYYLDMSDKAAISDLGVNIKSVPGHRIKNFLKRFFKRKAQYYYGIYVKS